MKRTSVAHMHCSIAQSLEILGEWWTLLVLRDIFYGARRFEALQADLGISRNILTDRLKTLVAHDILERRRYQDSPPRHEYRLTDRGAELVAVLLDLMQWGDRWLLGGPDSAPAVAKHKTCGHAVHSELRCAECGEVPATEVRIRPGPGARRPAARPEVSTPRRQRPT
ncbi:winged helix-turn-helix transcriptional regulator [Pseudonocardia sp. GCM10023141]|uniref:winged helix-turn-helix transcriptional regulator n=1 Tax=Pseudonocardia sp. GCM10023141 TaxID=3252653 RepID=UPI003610E855